MSSHITASRIKRQGLTLIEVLLATALLAMSLAALGQLQSTGIRASLGAQLEAEAFQLCQTELDAIVAGRPDSFAQLEPPNSAAIVSLISQPAWSRRAFVEATPTAGLLCVTVEIYRTGNGQTKPLATLSRWVSGRASNNVGGQNG